MVGVVWTGVELAAMHCRLTSPPPFLCSSVQGARMVRELFEMARSKKACLIFFDEIDAVGGWCGCVVRVC